MRKPRMRCGGWASFRRAVEGRSRMDMLECCLWCEAEFVAKKVGANPKRFCSPKCKTAFHTAARRWAERALADGFLCVSDLRDPAASYTTDRLAGQTSKG